MLGLVTHYLQIMVNVSEYRLGVTENAYFVIKLFGTVAWL